MATTKPSSRPKLRILMLHGKDIGYTQSGSLFYAKTRALEKHLQRAFPAARNGGGGDDRGEGGVGGGGGGVELVYPTAPIRLRASDLPGFSSAVSSSVPAEGNPTLAGEDAAVNGTTPEAEDIDAWAWWRRDDVNGTYTHLSTGLDSLASVLKTQGPFTGVIGFSQGGAAAAMLASLLEPEREAAFGKLASGGGILYPTSFLNTQGEYDSQDAEGQKERIEEKKKIHPPLKFAVSYSGFAAPNPIYAAFYDPPLTTPMLHFIGSLDTVVEESRSLRLVQACGGGDKAANRAVYHPGGHFLPAQKQFLNVLVGFLKEILGEGDS